MKIVVVGGTGLIGSKTVPILREDGHEVLAASPKGGVNTVTGEGLKEAVAGAEVVIDVSNAPSFDRKVVLEFFEISGRDLVAAETAAGVRHHMGPVQDLCLIERLGRTDWEPLRRDLKFNPPCKGTSHRRAARKPLIIERNFFSKPAKKSHSLQPILWATASFLATYQRCCMATQVPKPNRFRPFVNSTCLLESARSCYVLR
jgi:hypothetical protein